LRASRQPINASKRGTLRTVAGSRFPRSTLHPELTTATSDTDKALLSLTYVALARIYEHFNKPDEALKLYDQAIKLGQIGAFQDAMAGKQRLLLKPE
jgi:hypothetical protein